MKAIKLTEAVTSDELSDLIGDTEEALAFNNSAMAELASARTYLRDTHRRLFALWRRENRRQKELDRAAKKNRKLYERTREKARKVSTVSASGPLD